jgi:hypothetical protein
MEKAEEFIKKKYGTKQVDETSKQPFFAKVESCV